MSNSDPICEFHRETSRISTSNCKNRSAAHQSRMSFGIECLSEPNCQSGPLRQAVLPEFARVTFGLVHPASRSDWAPRAARQTILSSCDRECQIQVSWLPRTMYWDPRHCARSTNWVIALKTSNQMRGPPFQNWQCCPRTTRILNSWCIETTLHCGQKRFSDDEALPTR